MTPTGRRSPLGAALIGAALLLASCAERPPAKPAPAKPAPAATAPAATADRAPAPATADRAPAPTPTEGSPMRNKTPQPPTRYTPGPAIDPPAALRAWLTGADAPRGRIRLPVVITRDSLHLTSAHIGARPEPPGPDSIRLRLSDSTLGISLADRLRGAFGPGPGTHAVWLEGQLGDPTGLGAALDAVGPGGAGSAGAKPDDRVRLEVRGVGEAVDASAAPLRVGVEAPGR